MFAKLDADGDGSISKTEWDQHGADRAAKRAERGEKRAAAGEAGQGNRRAMRVHLGKLCGHQGLRMMGKADSDCDKAIIQAEFHTAPHSPFDAPPSYKPPSGKSCLRSGRTWVFSCLM